MERVIKSVCGAAGYIFTYLTKTINEIFIILAILMIFDYLMGIIKAIKNKTFDYRVGVWGIVKKLLYIMMLTTGYLADYLVNYLSKKMGLDFSTYGTLGFIITFYLLGNEGISLCYHWSSLGLPVPRMLIVVFEKFKLLARDNEYTKNGNTNNNNINNGGK